MPGPRILQAHEWRTLQGSQYLTPVLSIACTDARPVLLLLVRVGRIDC